MARCPLGVSLHMASALELPASVKTKLSYQTLLIISVIQTTSNLPPEQESSNSSVSWKSCLLQFCIQDTRILLTRNVCSCQAIDKSYELNEKGLILFISPLKRKTSRENGIIGLAFADCSNLLVLLPM